MTTEQINVALAERSGWEFYERAIVKHGKPLPWTIPHVRHAIYTSGVWRKRCRLPNYCGNLNAIHAVVKVFSDEWNNGNECHYLRYHTRLMDTCQDDYNAKAHWSSNPIYATAEQRARAAVYAFNLETI
jgi:hypothetical protein